MTGDKWTIYWTEYTADTYLYGTEISFPAKDDVVLTNHLIPPGTVIKQWYSRTNFQSQGIEPTLPMIDGEAPYRLTVDLECGPHEHCLMRLIYYDRYDVEVGDTIIRDRNGVFRCPLSTYSYRLQLIAAGVTQLHFHKVMIQEISDEEAKLEAAKTK